jgi:hypothetical protein
MEFLEGEDLGSRLARGGAMEEKPAWAIARQAVAALAHAAAHGIVHRDVKPANLFLIPPPMGMNLPPGVPMVKVMDFGLALMRSEADLSADRLTPAGSVVGTPIYIYSLGATVVYALTGKPPFRAKSFSELVDQKLVWNPESDPRFSPKSAKLLARMMAPDPNSRISDYGELLDAIDDLLSDRSLTVETQAAGFGPRRPARWRIRGAVGLGIALTAIAAVWGASKIWPARESNAKRSAVEYVRRGDDMALFDKKSINDWLPPVSGGQWNLATDGEGGRVLEGTGFTRRRFVTEGDFRITLGFDLHEAALAEIHFALPADAPDSGTRMVLRISRSDGAALGSKDGDRGALQPIGESIAFPPPAWFQGRGHYLEVKIEHTGGLWAVWFNGHAVGQCADHVQILAPEIRLFADGGPARIDSAILTPLGPR